MAPLLLDKELRAPDMVTGVWLNYYAGAWQQDRIAAIAAGRKAALEALPELRRPGLGPNSL